MATAGSSEYVSGSRSRPSDMMRRGNISTDVKKDKGSSPWKIHTTGSSMRNASTDAVRRMNGIIRNTMSTAKAARDSCLGQIFFYFSKTQYGKGGVTKYGHLAEWLGVLYGLVDDISF